MKKVLLFALLLILLVNISFAKSILWVTNNPSSFQAEEKILVDRAKALGFNVDPLDSDLIYTNPTEWRTNVQYHDIIVFGQTSKTFNNESYRTSFCQNAKITDKPHMISFTLTEYEGIDNSGCPFNIWELVNYSGNNNSVNAFYGYIENNENYITKNYAKGGINLYSQDGKHNVANKTSGTILIKSFGYVENGPIKEQMPSIIIWNNPKRIYFGLNEPSKFTEKANDIFDRSILWLAGENLWNIEYYTIPEKITANQPFWLIAKILHRNGTKISDAELNYTLLTPGKLKYNTNSEYYENRNLSLPSSTELKLITTETQKIETLSVGTGKITILSGNFVPGGYLIKANFSGTNLNYRIRDYSTLEIISEGSLTKDGNIFQSEIEMPDIEQAILEVYSSEEGIMKIINKTEAAAPVLSLDKKTYIPGESVKILLSGIGLSNISLSLVKPDLEEPLSIGSMNKISYDTYGKNYTLAPSAANGTYTIIMTGYIGNSKIELNKTFDVIVFYVSLLTNKNIFTSGETMNISIQVSKDSEPAIANYSISIDGEKIFEGITDNKGLGKISYPISKDAPSGEYTIELYVWDNYHEDSKLYIEKKFTIFKAGTITINPSEWRISETSPGEDSITFSINNSGDINLTNIRITKAGNLANRITLDISKTKTALNPGESTSFGATIKFTDISSGEYDGNISVISSETSATIPVTLSFQEELTDELDIYPYLWKIVTITNKEIQNKFTLKNSASRNCNDILIELPKDIPIKIISSPNTISADSEEDLELSINTADLEEKIYRGEVKINCTTGYASINVNLEIIGNIKAEIDAKTQELLDINANISLLEKKKINVSRAISLYSEILDLFDKTKKYYDEEDYEKSKQSYSSALSKMQALKLEVETLQATKPSANYGIIIWAIAIIIILGIIGFMLYKYKDKIKEFIDNFIGKKKEEEQPEQYYWPEEQGGGEYRTGYY